VITADLIAPNT